MEVDSDSSSDDEEGDGGDNDECESTAELSRYPHKAPKGAKSWLMDAHCVDTARRTSLVVGSWLDVDLRHPNHHRFRCFRVMCLSLIHI